MENIAKDQTEFVHPQECERVAPTKDADLPEDTSVCVGEVQQMYEAQHWEHQHVDRLDAAIADERDQERPKDQNECRWNLSDHSNLLLASTICASAWLLEPKTHKR